MTRIALEYKPLEAHHPFHMSRAFERIAYGGYGSGKSYALCAELLALGLEQPGSEILVCRKTIPSLRDTTEAIFVSLIPPKLWDQCETSRAGGHYSEIHLPNGTKYMFKGLDDWMKLKSLSVAYIGYDEVDEIAEETYVGMMSRVRQRIPTAKARALGAQPITRRGIIAAANPRGHDWTWKRFVGPDRAENSEWFKSTSLQNPYLPADYLNQLLAMPDPWVKRYVLCDFDEFGGQIYEEWNRAEHVIKPYRKIDGRYDYAPDGLFIMGFDPGTFAGNAAVWCHYDRKIHKLVAVAEYLEKGLAADAHARQWRGMEATHRMRNVQRIADPRAITVRDRGSNMGLDDQYRRLGFSFHPGANAIETRVQGLAQLIHQRRFVVTEECPRLFEQIQNYRWEDLTPAMREKGGEPKPLKKDVDLVDAAQYVACRYVSPPKAQDIRTDKQAWDDDVRAAIRRQIRARSTATTAHDLGNMIV